MSPLEGDPIPGKRLIILAIIIIFTASVAYLDFVVKYNVAVGLVYLVPIAVCAWYFNRRLTLVLCVIVAVLRTMFVPEPCPHFLPGTHHTPPHLCLEYISGAVTSLIFYGLWGIVIRYGRAMQRRVDRLDYESLTDPLTGLYNLRFLEARVAEERTRADRSKKPLAFLLADIDHFKAYNDTNGHQKGDELLVAIGRTLRKNVRAIDAVCRYGGEEFLILLPETDANQAAIVAERIRSAVADADTGTSSSVTISIGLALYPRDAPSPELAILEAYSALHKAKDSGRNRVCGCAEPDHPIQADRKSGLSGKQPAT